MRTGRFFFSSRRRHTRWTGDWSSDVCSSDLFLRAQRTLVGLERGETGQTTKREIHLGHIALGSEILHAIRKYRIKLRGIDQVKEGAFGIDPGNNRLHGNFFAVFEDNARNRSVLDANLGDLRFRANNRDRKSTRLNSSHPSISYAVF